MNISPWFVLLLGMGTVFFGLFCLILLTKLMSLVLKPRKSASKAAAVSAPAAAAAPAAIASPAAPPAVNADEVKRFDAAISAAIAEYIGGDVTNIKITSVKKLSDNVDPRECLTAVISAAVATAMNRDVAGLRITGIRQI